MSLSLRSLLVLGALPFATLLACPARSPSSGGTQPEPVRIPSGCESSQAGEYHHVGNPAFRYVAEDDGRTLSLTVVSARLDGGVGGSPDAGGINLVLSRTPQGFVGETRATGFNVSGNPCPVKFPTEVTACADDSLKLRTVTSTALDEACRPPPSGAPPKWTEQVLRRGAPDAGVPDAGMP
ncbi:hypothetical protein [Hyalangium rubrum]|uniref:Lipoprotein n=1 Tax=Hyalangium rubrum TaxID=3103134 RepID=A0ABU5H6K6_9BACT|nr:hypothetical protein [Hyalangium sp. s54d21]MDY7228509.1 hypothetical protein [Hyalangium sp. s54d21]